MSPALSKAIAEANRELRFAEIEDARQNINAGLDRRVTQEGNDPEADMEETRHAGRLLLADVIEKLRHSMCEIGRACALDKEFGAKADANEGTFYKLFGNLDLDRKLLDEPDAVAAFLEGKESARFGQLAAREFLFGRDFRVVLSTMANVSHGDVPPSTILGEQLLHLGSFQMGYS